MLEVFLYEWKRQSLRKVNWIIFIFMAVNIFLVEFVYIYWVGPIGIFSNNSIMLEIVQLYGGAAGFVEKDFVRIAEDFSQHYGACHNAAAQMAREFMDCLGIIFYEVSFLVGCFCITKKQQEEDMKFFSSEYIDEKVYITGKFLGNAAFLTTALALFTLPPFLLSFQLKGMGYSGNPMAFWQYFITWILPTVCVVLVFQMLLSICFKDKEVGIIIHFALIFIMAMPGETFPFYKFVVRANGLNEAFYEAAKLEIAVNRICIIALTVILYVALMKMAEKRKKVSKTS